VAKKEHPAERVLELHAELAEGPVWDERSHKLFFVDILGEAVHCFDPLSKEHVSFDVGRPVGCVVLREDGGLALAAGDGFFLVNVDGSGLRRFGNLSANSDVVRFNDGKVCPSGRFLAGTMDWEKRQPIGALYMLQGDGRVSELVEKVTISNGLAWDSAGTTLYYIDSPRHQIDAFDFDPETGAVSRRRTIAEFPDVSPDGMAIDSEGLLWVACWGGSRVERVDPSFGRTGEGVRLPTSNVSSVAFGGPGMDDMYITTAREEMSAAQRAAEPEAGNIFVARPGVCGPPSYRFKLE